MHAIKVAILKGPSFVICGAVWLQGVVVHGVLRYLATVTGKATNGNHPHRLRLSEAQCGRLRGCASSEEGIRSC
jgi:hypothetical protein